MYARPIIVTLVSFGIPTTSIAQTPVTSNWQHDGAVWDGAWSETVHWDLLGGSDAYPNNNVSSEYNVSLPIAGSTYTVTVDVGPVELLSLDIDNDGTLLLESTDFRPGVLSNAGVVEIRNDDLILAEDITNDGIIRFDTDTGTEWKYIRVQFDSTLNGTGTLLFQDTGTDTPSAQPVYIYQDQTLTNGPDHTVAGGAGKFYAPSTFGDFVNNGTVLANVPGRTLLFIGSQLRFTNNNLVSVLNGATLDNRATFTNLGTLTVDSASQLNFASGGWKTIGGTLTNNGVIIGKVNVTFDGTSGSGTGEYHHTSDTVTFGDNTMVEFGTVSIEGDAILVVQDGGLVTVIDHYTYTLRSEGDHSFNFGGGLRVTGGTAVGPTDYGQFAGIEIGGEDLGTDPDNHIGDPQGFIRNFHLPRLIIGPSAKVNLFDVINNGNRNGPHGDAEALYVDTLEFEDANGLLNLNRHHLYYNTLIGNPSQIVDSAEHVQSLLYVDDDAGGANNGLSWCDAFIHLQDALALAAASGGAVTEIRVAQGIYKPDQGASQTPGKRKRDVTLQLVNGVSLYGGYAGCGASDPDERSVSANVTILSGDLNGDDSTYADQSSCETAGGVWFGSACTTIGNNGENSYHVVTGSGTDATAVLDGFTVTGGNANGALFGQKFGAGMYNGPGSLTVKNCIFVMNTASVG
ncbi:MAG: hypothetical protein ACE5M4_14315, partial [Anaerolineales bacterium]